eukprot:JP448542.1.p2 GENE.JP448542.1~~JP448542.1.p2  ORF type:complete len:86 (+),score=17.55 JP448542.1:41-298(+)
MSNQMNMQSQLEHLQLKYVGTGHADVTKFEWAINQHRDTYASSIGHHSMLGYGAIAQNESLGRMKYTFLQNMLQPCGKPPEKEEE